MWPWRPLWPGSFPVVTPLVAMTIAGTDSAGGAGVHADLRTFAAFGLHGASAIAALTAQNTRGIERVHLVPADFVVAQVESVIADLELRAVKTGFLGSVDVVRAIGGLVGERPHGRLVVDPVLVRADGGRLFAPDVEDAYRTSLAAPATVLTPNRVEAGLLAGADVETVADMERAARTLLELGPEVVVVKGGDAADEGDDAVDVVAARDGTAERLVLPMVTTGNDHGSGCSFAAATAARLALGDTPLDAVRSAKGFVHEALRGAAGWRLGAGHGPLDQLGWEGRAPDRR